MLGARITLFGLFALTGCAVATGSRTSAPIANAMCNSAAAGRSPQTLSFAAAIPRRTTLQLRLGRARRAPRRLRASDADPGGAAPACAALASLGLGLPPRRITVNLAPTDVLKEGSHFDLSIALALLAAMDALPADELGGYMALGEVALDGSLTSVAGVLLVALAAASRDSGIHLPGGMRRRGGLGGRGRGHRGAEPLCDRQSFQGGPAGARKPDCLSSVCGPYLVAC
jgi:hypothetical protein